MLILLFKIDAKIHLFSLRHKHSWAFFQKSVTLTLITSFKLILHSASSQNTSIA